MKAWVIFYKNIYSSIRTGFVFFFKTFFGILLLLILPSIISFMFYYIKLIILLALNYYSHNLNFCFFILIILIILFIFFCVRTNSDFTEDQWIRLNIIWFKYGLYFLLLFFLIGFIFEFLEIVFKGEWVDDYYTRTVFPYPQEIYVYDCKPVYVWMDSIVLHKHLAIQQFNVYVLKSHLVAPFQHIEPTDSIVMEHMSKTIYIQIWNFTFCYEDYLGQISISSRFS